MAFQIRNTTPHTKRKMTDHGSTLKMILLTAITLPMLANASHPQLTRLLQIEVKDWLLNAIAPATTLVSQKENLDWRLQSSSRIKAGDCIRFQFSNPYQDDAPETYKSFDMSTPYAEPCNFSTSHIGQCTTIDAQTFQIQFSEDNPNTKITGTSTGKPFQNPYSSRSFSKVTTVFYVGCNLSADPVVAGDTTISSFQQAVVLENEVQLASNSPKLAVTTKLFVSFKPKSIMPASGIISLSVPPWYTITSQQIPNQYSSESMLGFQSQAAFETQAGQGFKIDNQEFDASSRQIKIKYSGSRIIPNTEQVVISISHFKNPVNKNQKKGFRLALQDKLGYLVASTQAELILQTEMTEEGRLFGKEVLMLGDSEGLNIGRVFEYNKMSFFMSSFIPFEQFCYFKIKFPQKLVIDSALQIIEGEGIFQPTRTSTMLPTTDFRVDVAEQTVYVEGCKQPEFISSRPFGVIKFSYVLLPDYITDTDPVEVYAYSDPGYQDLVYMETKEQGGGLQVTREMLQPGTLDLVEFAPSNYYAYVQDVKYTVKIRPAHDMLPTTRIVIDMPEFLIFDRAAGCTVTYTECDCAFGDDPDKNELLLTNIFSERTAGGSLLKFEISFANNPEGSRYAGDWGARTEGIFEDRFHIVDGNDKGYSFFALPGYVKSKLDYVATVTFSEESTFDFTFETEHPIPRDGFIVINLPSEMAFPASVVASQDPQSTVGIQANVGAPNTAQDQMQFHNVTDSYIYMKFPTGHTTSQNPIRLTLSNLRTPRSFRPSSEFKIETRTEEGYVIDGGGSDITVEMNEMNSLTSIEITPTSQINGIVTDYIVKIDTFVYLENRDRVLITTPPTIGFDIDGISCDPMPNPVGVTWVSCENIDDQTFVITLQKVTRPDGIFELLVHGIKNPPNFRRSSLFSNIFFQTYDYYNIQKLQNYDTLFIQTSEVATITDYEQYQETELFKELSGYTITFNPANPISKDGVITLEWTEQVSWDKDSDYTCTVQTYQTFKDACVIDFDARLVKIFNVFERIQEDLENYKAPITITLEKLKNPATNLGLEPFIIKTFDDEQLVFPIDKLEFLPLTQCNHPCRRCSTDKDYCYACWRDGSSALRFLTTLETTSTCKDSCDDGWTTNGNTNQVCQRCAANCKTCLDNGVEGDADQCILCADGYNLRMGDECVDRCPIGTYLSGQRCLPCDSTCLSCEKPGECTACSSSGAFPFLYNNQCSDSCPSGMGNIAGVCFTCEFPCSQCSTAPKICTACDQKFGDAYLYGPGCIDQCPVGYSVNEAEKKCEGCGSGCDVCDENDQRICLQCESGLMMHLDECVSDCPKGYLSNYEASSCYPLSDLDIRLIPFPCLLIACVFLFLSYVGDKQKRKHLFVPNWLILMALLEHGCLLSQMILNFRFGTWKYGVFIILAWLAFIATNIAYVFVHYKKISKKDRLYNNWRNRPSNIWARRLMNVAGLIGTWKCYKLSYSAFWGVRLSPAKFTEPKNFRDLQKRFLWINILTCYSLIIILNVYGLLDMDWGTQLYIQMIENILIFLCVIWGGIWEQKKQETDYLSDQKYGKMGGRGKLNVMSALDEQDLPGFSKTREHLLGAAEVNQLFVERKFDELIKLFGDRMAKSFYHLNRDCAEDPRMVKTWPCTESVEVITPIEPLPDPYPDNVYSLGLTEEQMQQMKFLSKKLPSKAIQSDNFDADWNLRKDAFLVGHRRELNELERSTEKKRQRGRKNLYHRAIDGEDQDAGILLDEEPASDKELNRNPLLDKMSSLEARRQKENRKYATEETRQRAMMLTEENLRLKRQLEEQRQIDQKDQDEINKRIMEEESRRQAILASIEAARKEREARKNAMANNLQDEMQNRLADIERMEAEHMATNANMTAEQKMAAEASFQAERARLESEFNEKKLKLQLEATDGGPGSPILSQHSVKESTAVRLVPQGVAQSPNQSMHDTELDAVSAKRSALGSILSATSPIPGAHGVSMLQTADEATERSFLQDLDLNNREFNEIDIVGDLDRDDKGNLIVPTDEKTGSKSSTDKQGQPINQYGYLVDLESGDVLHNRSGEKMFLRKDLDERGNIPMPYALEKYNFNPFELLGTFFYDDVEDPLSFQKNQRGGRYIDELGRYISLQGFMVDKEGSVIDKDGIKRFDQAQFKQFGGLMPKLFNYYGKTFELQEVMGVFDRDSQGNIQLLLGKDERGKDVYVDKAGFMVNQKGYIVTKDGHICSREGKILFMKSQLKNSEFPKILPFTRFNINRVMGEVEMDPGGQAILARNERGRLCDKQGRLVNAKGFLIDQNSNVVDVRGKLVFEKALLENNGDIPEIFRSNILRSDSQSSLSRFMSEIDRDQQFDQSIGGRGQIRPGANSDTSFESMMDDSPSKYDKQNMRFSHSNPDAFGYGSGPVPRSARWAGDVPDNIMEEQSEYEAGMEPSGKRKRKKGKGKGYVVEPITTKDVQMASAYGGVAKPRIRKTAPRFATGARMDRAGLQTSQGQARPSNARMQGITKPYEKPFEVTQELSVSTKRDKDTDGYAGATTRGDQTTQRTGNTFGASKTGFRAGNTTGWRDQHLDSSMPESMDEEEQALMSQLRTQRVAAQKKRSNKKPKVEKSPNGAMQMPQYDRTFEEEFEKVYKKDIDKFIDGSDFEVESLAGLSEISKGTYKSALQNDPRMRGLEKVYLQRLEFQQLGQKAKHRPKPPVKREFLDRFCDDPKYIAKGEKLKFEIGNTTQGSSGRKKSPPPLGHSYMELQQQRSQSSLLGQDVGMVATTGMPIHMMRPPPTPQNLQLAPQDSARSGGHQRQPSPRTDLR